MNQRSARPPRAPGGRATFVAAVSVAVAVAALAAVWPSAAMAATTVSPLVGDHMVVEQGRPVRISGTDAPGQAIRASLGGAAAAATANAAGEWAVVLPALPAGGPHVLTVAGSSALRFEDVWSGEVWIASGQSNMELPVLRSAGGKEAIAGGCPGLRLFLVEQVGAASPRTQASGRWTTCDRATAAGFSAVAFYFGRELHRALGVPVGLVQAAWGGTPAEAWTPRAALLAEPALKPLVQALDADTTDPARRAELARKLAAWEAAAFPRDTGNRGEARGYARADGGRGWSTMELPQPWENTGLKIDGAVWFRREVMAPAEWAGRDLALSLGALDDFDVTYWNGERVGSTGVETPQYWKVPRRYTIPGRLVKRGRNVIAVRVFDHYGSGGFAGTAEQMTVGLAGAAGAAAGGASALPLAGAWSYKIERRLAPVDVDFSKRPQVLGPDEPTTPTVLWNGMMAPLAGLPVAGVIWYQGEGNATRAYQYRTLFPTMIRAWRAAWNDPALPFLFVQLPNYGLGGGAPLPLGDSAWAELREAQAMALRQPRTAMAVTLDIGESDDLHPRNKLEVGRRLALAALSGVYRRGDIAAGPTFEAAAREGNAMRVRFAPGSSGLDTSDGAPPKGFMIAGADRVWHAAAARIDGRSVIVSSPDVPDPVAVRYGWANDPQATLRSQADLPAAPFRTDDWPAITAAAVAP